MAYAEPNGAIMLTPETMPVLAGLLWAYERYRSATGPYAKLIDAVQDDEHLMELVSEDTGALLERRLRQLHRAGRIALYYTAPLDSGVAPHRIDGCVEPCCTATMSERAVAQGAHAIIVAITAWATEGQ